jgi:hypothetical protein
MRPTYVSKAKKRWRTLNKLMARFAQTHGRGPTIKELLQLLHGGKP